MAGELFATDGGVMGKAGFDRFAGAARPGNVGARVGLARVPSIPRQEALARLRFVQPHEIDVDDLAEESVDVALPHADREQQACLTRGILGKGAVPLRSGESGLEVGRRQDGDGASAGRSPLLHLVDEVLAGPEVPRLHEHGVAGGF